jgi:hypothetical protein
VILFFTFFYLWPTPLGRELGERAARMGKVVQTAEGAMAARHGAGASSVRRGPMSERVREVRERVSSTGRSKGLNGFCRREEGGERNGVLQSHGFKAPLMAGGRNDSLKFCNTGKERSQGRLVRSTARGFVSSWARPGLRCQSFLA